MKRVACLFCLLWAVSLVQSCSDDPRSPEDEIRQFLKSGVDAAENRSASDLADKIHDNYLDQKGYNKERLAGLLRAYFFRHKNIHLFTRIDQIELLAENEAVARLHVAMAGTAISGVESLTTLRAQIYRFELQLVKRDEWLLRHAVWAPASISAFE